MSAGENSRNCSCYPGVPNFQFATPQFQNAANTVYNQKTAFDSDPANVAQGRVYTFKSDFERMQALILDPQVSLIVAQLSNADLAREGVLREVVDKVLLGPGTDPAVEQLLRKVAHEVVAV